MRPTPSPDGKSLAFIRRVRYKSTLFILDLESGKETPIYDGLDRDMQETWAIHGVYPTMAWTPDNKSIVFWAGGQISRIDVASKAVTPIPFHVHAHAPHPGSAARSRSRSRRRSYPGEDAALEHASRRTGKQVVYGALGYLYIRDLPTGTPQRLTKQTDHFEFYPAWSRDGKSIVYTTWNDQTLGTIRIAPAAGGEGRVDHRQAGPLPRAGVLAGRIAKSSTARPATASSVPQLWSRETGIYVVPVGRRRVEAGHEERRIAAVRRVERPRLLHDRSRTKTSAACTRIGLDGTDERAHLHLGASPPSTRSRPTRSGWPSARSSTPTSRRSSAPARRSTSVPTRSRSRSRR